MLATWVSGWLELPGVLDERLDVAERQVPGGDPQPADDRPPARS